MTRHRCSENFIIEEFDCRDGTKVPPAYYQAFDDLCRTFLEPLRRKYGPCTVNSGFRTETYNIRIGGARFSFHVITMRAPSEGVAADIRFRKGSVKDWWRSARWLRWKRRARKGGIGYYPQGGFIHVDTRDYKADWNGS